jgi:hypothetical protein
MLTTTETFILGLKEIEIQIQKTEKYVLDDHEYFQEQVNFFTKSIIILICTHFESYSKEVVKFIVKHYSDKLKDIEIPSNLLLWDVEKDNYKEKEKDTKNKEKDKDPVKNHILSINDEDIDRIISANPYKVKNALMRCGVNLELSREFIGNIEIINSLVDKRNQIIHYNQGVADISLGDLKYYLKAFNICMLEIDKVVEVRLDSIIV